MCANWNPFSKQNYIIICAHCTLFVQNSGWCYITFAWHPISYTHTLLSLSMIGQYSSFNSGIDIASWEDTWLSIWIENLMVINNNNNINRRLGQKIVLIPATKVHHRSFDELTYATKSTINDYNRVAICNTASARRIDKQCLFRHAKMQSEASNVQWMNEWITQI